MPRPGPRPYECVRRAWHSDRHQPMRGSIIQQIFRVVHESHSPVTKKNREWQEKLPIVVLKAEKIMYSKANSEAEYVDLETVWDRVNDAINTIIRREESAETGELLPPCIEAALELGCVPVKASRSQRQSNPRTYLPPRAQEPNSVPRRISENSTVGQKLCSPPIHSSNQLTFGRPLENANSIHLASGSNRYITQNNNASRNFPLSHKQTQCIPMESSSLSDGVSVYPLYYGTDFPLDLSKLEFRIPKDSDSIAVGTPINSSVEVGTLQNVFSSDRKENASNRTTRLDLRDKHGNSSVPECDLSLRLGFTRDRDDVCSISSQEEGKFSHFSPSRKEFPFFPMKSANDPFEFRARKWNPEGEGQNTEEAVRKRKAPFNYNVEDEQFFCVPGSSFNPLSGCMKRPVFFKGWASLDRISRPVNFFMDIIAAGQFLHSKYGTVFKSAQHSQRTPCLPFKLFL